MNKRQKKRLQLLLVNLVISVVGALLVGWITGDVFDLPFAPAFLAALLIIGVPSGRAMFKIPIDDAGKLESEDAAEAGMSGGVGDQRGSGEPASFRRIMVRALLFGALAMLTAATVAAVHLTSRLGMHGLNRIVERGALVSDATVVLGCLVLGLLVAALLEVANSKKG